jgi:ABC-2 type transport system permease protein
MPVYEQSYRHWNGVLNPKTQQWLIIARSGIKMLWRKWMIILVAFAAIPFFIRVAHIYIATRLADTAQFGKFASQIQINPELFKTFLNQQSFFILLIIVFAGAGLISKDKRFNALQLYFSKPLSKWDYLMGKFVIVGFYVFIISLLPALLLFLTKVLISENLSFLKQYYWVPFALLGFYLIITLIYGGLILALSSLGKGARFAGIGFFAIYVLTDLIKKILAFEPNIGVISIGADVKQMGDFIFGLPLSNSFPIWLTAVVLLILCAGCFFILNSQVRGTDIVK